MDIQKCDTKLIIKTTLFHGMMFFSFLFYLVWSKPISILNRELPINEYQIFDHNIVQISFVLAVLWMILYCYLSLKHQRMSRLLLLCTYTIILLCTLISFIAPYNYKGFEDNITLSATGDLLGFSKWRYLLDIVLIGVCLSVVYFSIKAKFNLLFLVLFIYYTMSNIQIISSIKISPQLSQDPTGEIVLSSNHSNVVLFIFDTVNSSSMELYLTNNLVNQDTTWAKDFTFFDNVIALTTGGTLVSLPTIFGGYNFSPQNHLTKIVDTPVLELTNNPRDLNNGHFFMSDNALDHLRNTLNNKIDVKYDNIGFNVIKDNKNDTNRIIMTNHIIYPKIPILAVSLYEHFPYFMRKLLVSSEKNWAKIFYFPYKWIHQISIYTLKIMETSQPKIQIIHTMGLHPYGGPSPTIENMCTQLDISVQSVQEIVRQLKKYNIYNNTKIIIGSDHGHYDYSPSYQEYYQATVNPKYKDLYQQCPYHQIDSFLMLKDFNVTNSQMKIDHKLLSTGDIYATLVTSFTNISGVVDYTKARNIHQNTAFNIPLISWHYLVYLILGDNSSGVSLKNFIQDIHNVNFTESNGQYIKYLHVRDKTDFEERIYPLSNIQSLPIIEKY